MFTALQQIEGHIVAPNVFGHALRINPLLVIFALLLGGQIYGFLGRVHRAPDRGRAARDGRLPAPPPGARAVAAHAGRSRSPGVGTRGRGAAPSAARRWRPARRAAAPAGPSWAAPTRPRRRRRPGRRDGRHRQRARRPDRRRRLEGLRRAPRAAGRVVQRAPRRADRDHRAQRRRQDDAAADPRRRRSSRAAARCRSTGGEIGWVPQQPALYSKLSVAENLRLFARLEQRAPTSTATVERMLEQTGLRDRARDEIGLAVGRQPPARQHRHRPARRALGAAARRADLLARPAPARAAVGVRRAAWPSGGTTVVYATHNVAEAERYADRVLVLADGELLFSGSPRELERTVGGDAEAPDFEAAFVRFLRRAGPREPRADALAAAQGPADPAPLAAAGRRADRLLRPGLAARRPRAVLGARASRRSPSPTSSPPATREIALGGRKVDASQYADKLFEKVDPIRVKTREEAIEKVRSGEALGALVVPADVTQKLQGTLGLGGGGRPTVEVYYNAENPLKRQFVQDTINATLADANQAISGEVLREAAQVPRRDRHGREGRAADRGRRRHPRPAALARDHRGARSRRCPRTRPQRAGLEQVSRFAGLAADNLDISKPILALDQLARCASRRR